MTRYACPICRREISPSHVKRHLRTHGDVDKNAADIAWIRELERRDQIGSDIADAMVEIVERRVIA